MKDPVHTSGNEHLRILRIAHASLTPALRQRERAFARRYPEVRFELVTTSRWREAEVDVDAVDDDLFPVTRVQPRLSNHIQLFAYTPKPIVDVLRRFRPQVIDLNHEPYSVACAEIMLLCNRYAPQAAIILQACQNIHKNYPPPFNWFEWWAMKRAAAAHVCSETVREVLRAKGFTKPVAIVPFGVDTHAFAPRATGIRIDGTPTIGFVGRMLHGKGLNILAEALGMLASEQWNLLLVGDGPERAGFERALGDRGLLSRARFAGAISYDQVPKLYHEIDMLVMPTETTDRIREQFGRVLVEAMASGVPVIGSTCGAIPEVIGDAGLVFPERDAGALAVAIKRMFSDLALRERLAKLGRTRVEQNYSWEVVAGKTYEFFEQVLSGTTAMGAGARISSALRLNQGESATA
jgi:glycosyltransferase involved in cell wall biosynthesis